MKEVIWKMNRGKIKLEIVCISPENFLNLLWREGVFIEDVKKHSIASYSFKINAKDFNYLKQLSEENKVRIKVIKSFGLFNLIGKIKKRKAFVLGIFLFLFIIYYFSQFIWLIDINTENNVSPYEIRTKLNEVGVKPGIRKKDLNIFNLENIILNSNKSVVWTRVRIEGTKLKVEISERQNPPKIKEDNIPCDIVAKKDGVIQRVYTKSGTAIVEEGQVVKKGDILVKGEQGKEDSKYEVKAEGDVIAKTFYENTKKIKIPIVKRTRTGKTFTNRYIKIKNKKIYIKNDLNKFKKYDKIEDNNGIIKKEVYYEVEETKFTRQDEKKMVSEELIKLYSDIRINFNNDIKVIQKIDDSNRESDYYDLRVLVIAEEDIGEDKAIEREKIEEKNHEEIENQN
ncbi:sporulation protein YqfD [Hathewaya histolytica]|uniref:Stage IV sporulation protein n=2 Tax=Hathewaya histolytica TaxID=1498 RepID=A0A4U9RH54_HATHI|nr:stage IV sporulation protein [Hathewaya histolytica]